ncbi:MAG: cobalamin biosynthesis protein CbiD, partial [bacterium]|nr:cobalamin biosynthesis protein CbiD [bacterium]
KLKKGFTTGAAAAASVKAGLITLLTCQTPKNVEIRFLTGQTRVIPVHNITTFSSTFCEASVIKDAGDDPDITHKAEIGAVVTLKSGNPGVTITGGKGVGMVTKPGLEVEVGNPAINSGPRQMIKEAIQQTYQQLCLPFRHHVHVEVFVPKGEILAKKPLNARLGILGGISILGTTGIVTPMSHDAYIATIKSSINVAAANKIDTLVFTTGRRSERFAMEIFTTFKEDAFIQTGDFFKASLDM